MKVGGWTSSKVLPKIIFRKMIEMKPNSSQIHCGNEAIVPPGSTEVNKKLFGIQPSTSRWVKHLGSYFV